MTAVVFTQYGWVPMAAPVAAGGGGGGGNVAPGAPGSVSAVASGSTALAVSWVAASDSDGTVAFYEVRANGVLKATVPGLTATITGLAAATIYTVAVRAVDNLGASSPDAIATGTTAAAVTPGAAYTHPSGVIVPAGFPNPNNTGWAAKGLALTQLALSDSDWRIDASKSGTPGNPNVISRKRWFNQDVRVFAEAHDVTFRECDFSTIGVWAVYLEPGSTRIRFEDCTFHGHSLTDDVTIAGSDRLENGILSAGCTDWAVERCNFYWLTGGIYSNGSDVSIRDNYFHDFTYWSGTYFAPNGDHTNASGPAGGSSKRQVYQHNTVLMIRAANQVVFDQTSCFNFAQDDPTAYDNITVDNNFFVGNQGGHMILGYEPGKGGAPGTNFKVTNNIHSNFGTASPPRAGYHGQPTWNTAPANNVWTNNVWVGADSTTVQGTLAPVTT